MLVVDPSWWLIAWRGQPLWLKKLSDSTRFLYSKIENILIENWTSIFPGWTHAKSPAVWTQGGRGRGGPQYQYRHRRGSWYPRPPSPSYSHQPCRSSRQVGNGLFFFIIRSIQRMTCQFWYLLYYTWLTLKRSLRVSKSLLITLYHAGTVFNRFVFEK